MVLTFTIEEPLSKGTDIGVFWSDIEAGVTDFVFFGECYFITEKVFSIKDCPVFGSVKTCTIHARKALCFR
jgi:hypothetical protein